MFKPKRKKTVLLARVICQQIFLELGRILYLQYDSI